MSRSLRKGLLETDVEIKPYIFGLQFHEAVQNLLTGIVKLNNWQRTPQDLRNVQVPVSQSGGETLLST